MFLSQRVQSAKESITLTVNEKINRLVSSGKHVYNMTSGQLPFKPSADFIEHIEHQLNFLKSYQYGPIGGDEKLKLKFIEDFKKKRSVHFSEKKESTSCIISNGSKQSLYNALGAVIDPSDEVIIITPYWVSYPEMIKFWQGVPIEVKSHAFDAYVPSVSDIKDAIGPKTKAIIINSPNNPAGIHYGDEWMKDFARLIKAHPNIVIISDEIYSEICYFDPRPKYFYQFDRTLLDQTLVVNGISKTFASTGLRIGYCIGNRKIIEAMEIIQGQTTSGPNSLIQRSLSDLNFEGNKEFYQMVEAQLRECAQIVRLAFRDHDLGHCWYQTTSAFYYLLNFERMPFFQRYSKESDEEDVDYSEIIVEDILKNTGVALVPGHGFGRTNCARMSMTIELVPFEEAIKKLFHYMTQK